MPDTISNPNPSHWNALRKIVKRLPANLAYYGSALGAIVLAGGGQLPPGLEFVAGSIGGNMLSNMISDILEDGDLLDDEIRQRAEEAIRKSDIANLLTKQDFLQGYARLIQRLDAQKTISQDILDELRTGFSKVATADQVEELKRLILQLMQQPPQTAARKVRLFISYARADDESFVERLYHDLKDEFDVWWDRETMSNRGKTFLQEIRDAIDWSDRLVLVAGPRAFTSNYVRDEWQYAYETYKGINIALRIGDKPKVPDNLPEQLRSFDTQDFRNDADYAQQLVTLKRQLAEPVAPIGAFHNVPALPPHFLNRPDALDALRELVIADVDKPTLISAEKRTTAVEGMGGIGKSALATAFAHDRKVRFAFPDGIVWLTAGRDAKLYELYRAVGIALGDDLSNYPDETTARQNAQKTIAGKKCLLILDDLWELPVGRAFRDLISGTVTRLLITTRNLQINDLLNANEYRLKLIDKSQAADYLRSWAGDDPKLEEIAEKLGYLFLALKLAGARMKKDNLSGADYLRTFDRVSRMKIDRNATDRDDSLEVSITLSVDAAFTGIEDDKLLYHTFGIFQEDSAIPQQTILQLWQYLRPGVDEFDLLETLNTLVDLTLVERHDDRTITLHDLLHSYTREQLGDRYIQMHQNLLLTYRKLQTGHGWHTAPDDGYLYDYLAYHLISAHLYDDLKSLFLSDSWAHVRVKQKGYLYEGYLSDVLVAWDFAHSQALNLWDEQFFADCARYALIVTKVNDLSATYVPELVVRALQVNVPDWTNERALSIASRVTNSEQRLYFYVKLLSSALFEGKQREFCVENAVSALEESIFNRAPSVMVRRGIEIEVYEELAANIQNEANNFQRLLNALFEEDQEYNIARVIARIGQYIPEELLDSLLEKALSLEFDGDWGSLSYKAVKGIIQRLNTNQLESIVNHKTLDTDTRELVESYLTQPEKKPEVPSDAIKLPSNLDEFIDDFEFTTYSIFWSRSSLAKLKLIAGKLSEDQINKLIKRTLEFEDSGHPSELKRKILEILSPHLNEKTQIQTLHKVVEIDKMLGWEFISILDVMVRYLSPKSVVEAYEILTTEANFDRIRGFRILAPVLDETLLVRAIKDVSQSVMPYGLVLAMTHFLPHLPYDSRQDVVRQIQVYINNMESHSSYQKEELLIELAKANLQDIELVADIVRFIFNSDLFLLRLMSSLAGMLEVLHQGVTHPTVLELINELQNQIDKVDDRDKPFVIAYIFSLKLKLLDVVAVENKAKLQEEFKNLLILAITGLLEWGNLQPFFSAILISKDHLEGDRLDQVLSMILDCQLDYSNTDDLSFFSAFATSVTKKAEWISKLIDELIRIRGGNNTNAPLLRALIPAFLDKPNLLHKALHYADALPYADDRIVTVIEIASHLQDEDFRFHLISRELEAIKKDVKEGLHTDQIIFVSRILESCGNALSHLAQELKVFANVANSLPSPYARSRSLASIGRSSYFTEELRLDLRKNILKTLLEEQVADIANVWHILSYPSFLEHLVLTPTTISEIYDTIFEIENQWEWL